MPLQPILIIGISVAMVNIFNVGSTKVIGAIEFEPGLQKDLPAILNQLIPENRDYLHEQTWHDGNGIALGSNIELIPIEPLALSEN